MFTKLMKIADIQVSEDFLKTTPKKEKMQMFRDEFKRNRKFSKPITIGRDGFLCDGYARYLVLKEFGVLMYTVNVKGAPKEKEVVYIHGTHPNQHTNKEYVWRVPNKRKFAAIKENVLPGDTVFAYTKYGVMPVIVSKMEKLHDVAPDEKIKTIAKANFMRGGEVIGN